MRKKTGSIQDRGTSFRIRYTDSSGIRHHESYPTREEAEQQLAIRLGEMAQDLPVSSKPNTVLFKELAGDVMVDYEVNGYRSAPHAELRFRVHLIPVFGDRKAASITTAQIKWYTLERQKSGAAHATINRELELMRHTFNLALRGRKLMQAPHVPLLRLSNVRKGFFTREEVDRLCAHLKAPIDSFVLFAFLTGWRLDEIRSLQWRNVDFIAGEIRLDPGTTKNEEGRVFPMLGELREILAALRKAQQAKSANVGPGRMPAAPAFHVQVFRIGKKPIGEFRKAWRTACHAAGLPCIIDKETGKPIRALRIFHDLRRSAAREFQRQGFTEGQIMRMMGHKTRSMFDRYNICTNEDIRAKMMEIAARRAAKGAAEGGGTA